MARRSSAQSVYYLADPGCASCARLWLVLGVLWRLDPGCKDLLLRTEQHGDGPQPKHIQKHTTLNQHQRGTETKGVALYCLILSPGYFSLNLGISLASNSMCRAFLLFSGCFSAGASSPSTLSAARASSTPPHSKLRQHIVRRRHKAVRECAKARLRHTRCSDVVASVVISNSHLRTHTTFTWTPLTHVRPLP